MAPKTGSSGKDYKSSAKAQLKTSKIASSQPSRSLGRYNEAKWHTQDYKPQRKISDQELAAARQIFFALDVDASGSIDADELGVMLRSLGQNPTEQELKDLIVRTALRRQLLGRASSLIASCRN